MSNLVLSKILKGKYFPDVSVLEVNEHSPDSYMWKGLLWGRDLLSQGLRWKVGNDNSIWFLKDKWISREGTFQLASHSDDSDSRRVVDFITPNFEWDIDQLRNRVNEIPISKSGIQDSWLWHFDKRGKYSVKSGYKFHMFLKGNATSSSHNQITQWWQTLWKLKIPSKIKIFIWRIYNGCIPTRANLEKKGLAKSIESIDHALFTCKRARNLWRMIFPDIQLPKIFQSNIQDRLHYLDSTLCKKDLEIACVTCWSLWNDRNHLCQSRQIPDVNFKRDWIFAYMVEIVKGEEIR